MDSGFHRTGNIGNKVTFEKTMCEIKKEHKKNEGGVIRSFFCKNFSSPVDTIF